jgi:hypothetical protein
MDKVKNCYNYINLPSSRTYRFHINSIYMYISKGKIGTTAQGLHFLDALYIKL